MTHFLFRLKQKMFGSSKPQRSFPNLEGDRDIEWSWVAGNLNRLCGKVLDFGCGYSPMGIIAHRMGHTVTAVDLQSISHPFILPGFEFKQGDIRRLDLGEANFDIVINCSSIEHVGISGRYGSDDAVDGDLWAMECLRHLLKPLGIMILTLPVGQDSVFPPLHRVYGNERLPRLLKGLKPQRQEFWVKNNSNRWMLSDEVTALRVEASESFYALGLFVLQRS